MIYVLIAEDEPPTMRRLARMIEQSDSDFSIAATALDGVQALEQMANIQCDVVFTDIRMPVMDGLELMDALHEKYPDTIVVVVSGYQDFEYVTHAMRLQSLDYILKPVSAEALDNLLCRIKEEVGKRRHTYISQNISNQINRPKAEFSQTSHKSSELTVCLFCAGALPVADNAEMFPGAAAWNEISPEGLLREFSFDGFAWEFMGNTPVERILIFEADGASSVDIIHAVHEYMQLITDIPVNCACYREPVDVTGVGKAFRCLRKALPHNIHIGESGFFIIGEEDDFSDSNDDRAWSENLAEYMSKAPLRDVDGFISMFMEALEEERWTQSRLFTVFMDTANLLGTNVIPVKDIQQYRDFLTEIVCTSLSADDIRQGIMDIMEYQHPVSQDSRKRHNQVVQEIKNYIDINYASHINNKTLAAEFGYVPSYISKLFRKEYGISPADYLTKVRLEKAKLLFMDNPDMLVREIAESVGFKSQHHFTRIFKKNEGLAPSSYHFS